MQRYLAFSLKQPSVSNSMWQNRKERPSLRLKIGSTRNYAK